jgi:hypothetical protein
MKSLSMDLSERNNEEDEEVGGCMNETGFVKQQRRKWGTKTFRRARACWMEA